MSTDRALFRQFPGLQDALPIVELGNFPTPVGQAESLGAELDCASLWIKHDEHCAPSYGGNKIRKLEFLLGDIQARGFNSVLTFGGAGSNHALATAINCKQLGLSCTAVLTPEPPTDAVRKTLRYHLALGTNIRYARHYAEVRATADAALEELGDTCYEIPFGGSSWVGSCGFVNAGLELAEQINNSELPAPDAIYLPLGTTGSATGLALGLQFAGISSRIEAIQVTPPSMHQDLMYEKLFGEACKELNARDVHVPLKAEPFAQTRLHDDQLGDGYAIPTEAAREAAQLASDHLDFPVSLTYTAKALAGMFADARADVLQGQHVLFWNTYNAQPYPGFTVDTDWQALPASLHEYFDSPHS